MKLIVALAVATLLAVLASSSCATPMSCKEQLAACGDAGCTSNINIDPGCLDGGK